MTLACAHAGTTSATSRTSSAWAAATSASSLAALRSAHLGDRAAADSDSGESDEDSVGDSNGRRAEEPRGSAPSVSPGSRARPAPRARIPELCARAAAIRRRHAAEGARDATASGGQRCRWGDQRILLRIRCARTAGRREARHAWVPPLPRSLAVPSVCAEPCAVAGTSLLPPAHCVASERARASRKRCGGKVGNPHFSTHGAAHKRAMVACTLQWMHRTRPRYIILLATRRRGDRVCAAAA